MRGPVAEKRYLIYEILQLKSALFEQRGGFTSLRQKLSA